MTYQANELADRFGSRIITASYSASTGGQVPSAEGSGNKSNEKT
jgi:hypothetical protein